MTPDFYANCTACKDYYGLRQYNDPPSEGALWGCDTCDSDVNCANCAFDEANTSDTVNTYNLTPFTECLHCENGMINVNDQCVLPQIDNCDVYSTTANDECDECADGYTIVATDKRLCHPCEIEGCIECSYITVQGDQYQTCHYCDVDFSLFIHYLDDYETKPQAICNYKVQIPFCTDYDDEGDCLECSAGKSYDPILKICRECEETLPGCDECNFYGDECTACIDEDTPLIDGKCTTPCQEIDPLCGSCDRFDQDVCQRCQSNLVFGNNGKCTCGGTQTMLNLDNKPLCMPCSRVIDNCLTCNGVTCTQCEDGYYIGLFGECVADACIE